MYQRGADDAISLEEEDVDDAPFDDSYVYMYMYIYVNIYIYKYIYI